MSINDYGIGSHTCGLDVVEGRRVILGANDQITYAPATKLGHGVTRNAQLNGEDVGVAYFNKPGTHHMESSGAIALGADVFAAPSGRIQALPTTAGEYIKVGVAYEAAAEVGDLIEVLPNECGKVITVS